MAYYFNKRTALGIQNPNDSTQLMLQSFSDDSKKLIQNLAKEITDERITPIEFSEMRVAAFMVINNYSDAPVKLVERTIGKLPDAFWANAYNADGATVYRGKYFTIKLEDGDYRVVTNPGFAFDRKLIAYTAIAVVWNAD